LRVGAVLSVIGVREVPVLVVVGDYWRWCNRCAVGYARGVVVCLASVVTCGRRDGRQNASKARFTLRRYRNYLVASRRSDSEGCKLSSRCTEGSRCLIETCAITYVEKSLRPRR
jgi:hypothetical protein